MQNAGGTIHERHVFWPIHFCEPDCPKDSQRMNKPNDQKELTGPPARSVAACPRGFEGAGAGPLVAPGAAAGAAAGHAATKGPAPRSPCPCPRSSPLASTMSRTSTWAAWAGLPATVPGPPLSEVRRKVIAWTAVEARTASGPVAAGTPPVPSSEESREMCCGLRLGDCDGHLVSYECFLFHKQKLFQGRGEGEGARPLTHF